MQYYFDSLFPRTPVPVMRQIARNLEELGLPSAPAGVVASASRHGTDDGMRRPPSVKAALSVSFGQRAPHRASTRDASPVRRGLTGPKDRERNGREERSRNEDSQRGRDGGRGSDRYRDRDRDRDYRDSGRDRERPESRDRRNDDRYSRERDRDRDRGRDRDSYRDGGASQDRGRSREYERGRSSDRDRRSRERSRDRVRDEEASRPSRSPGPSANLQKLKDMYGDASGKDKGALGTSYGGRSTKDESAEEVIRLGGSKWR